MSLFALLNEWLRAARMLRIFEEYRIGGKKSQSYVYVNVIEQRA